MIDKKAVYIRDCDGCRCLGDSLELTLHTYKPLITPIIKEEKIVEKVKDVIKNAVKRVTKSKKK